MSKDYYVYGYVRLDTNTYFYIGKGIGNRYKRADLHTRSKHFVNILNKVPCAVEKIYTNLEEDEAYLLEQQTIDELVFEEGYSIEIHGFDKQESAFHLVNRNWGGQGVMSGMHHTEENKLKMSQPREKNGMWGKTGEKCPFYGIKRSKETKQKMSECHADFNGENNPFYGKKHTQEWKDKHGKTVHSPELENLGYEHTFQTLVKAREFTKKNFGISCTRISEVCNKKRAYNGTIIYNGIEVHLTWEWVEDPNTSND